MSHQVLILKPQKCAFICNQHLFHVSMSISEFGQKIVKRNPHTKVNGPAPKWGYHILGELSHKLCCHMYPLLICTWFFLKWILKNEFQWTPNLIFTTCIVCKIQVRNKQNTEFVKILSSKSIFQKTSANQQEGGFYVYFLGMIFWTIFWTICCMIFFIVLWTIFGQ